MKKNLLLLHGALGSKEQLTELEEKLSSDFKIYKMNFSGHGGENFPDEPFSIKLFSDELVKFINENNLQGIDVFGYSMGGYVALHAALNNAGTGLINKIFTTATKFDWNEETSKKEAGMLNPEKIEEKIPAFAEQLKQRHAPQDWKQVLNKTEEMMLNLGKNPELKESDFEKIQNEVLISVGDKDNMVSIQETKNTSEKIPNAKFLLLENTPHPIEKISVDLLSGEIKKFFK
ncbi:MAG TPA: alpha/beta fold hydrolase [Ignavibacteria bacterium]|nr:alpha/beta fold hydrolase [Ignavibacteria bacterium]